MQRKKRIQLDKQRCSQCEERKRCQEKTGEQCGLFCIIKISSIQKKKHLTKQKSIRRKKTMDE